MESTGDEIGVPPGPSGQSRACGERRAPFCTQTRRAVRPACRSSGEETRPARRRFAAEAPLRRSEPRIRSHRSTSVQRDWGAIAGQSAPGAAPFRTARVAPHQARRWSAPSRWCPSRPALRCNRPMLHRDCVAVDTSGRSGRPICRMGKQPVNALRGRRAVLVSSVRCWERHQMPE